MKTMDFLAFDMGASNGRGIIGRFDGRKVTLCPVHGFENNFVGGDEHAAWDLLRLEEGIRAGFLKAKQAGCRPVCFGIDTWGVDYGLLGKNGEVLGSPRAYRASRDEEMHAAWTRISERRLYEIAGLAAQNYNTVYQLYRRVLEKDPQLEKAQELLLVPDLLGYLLTGVRRTEYTIASTTGLLDLQTNRWSDEITAALSVPRHILGETDCAGTLRGALKPEIASALGVGPVRYAAVGCHDTASAVAAIPGSGNFAFCSSGTWSLLGMETEKPMLSPLAYESGISNEGTVQGGFRPLRNIMGLWLIQECRRAWASEGRLFSWDEIVAQAKAAPPLQSLLDPDDPSFFTAGDMPGKIQRFCERTGQIVPQTVGEIARCVYQSLALKYRRVLEHLSKLRGASFDSLNIVGGGIRNHLLNQMAADSLQLPVTAGPIEGAALGNILMQAIAMGELSNIEEARQVVRASVETKAYEPGARAPWDDAYEKLTCILHKV